MKIYRKLIIDIETGETLYEDSFEYDGAVAGCKKGEGSEPSIGQAPQSFQQMSVFNTLWPTLAQGLQGNLPQLQNPFQTGWFDQWSGSAPYMEAAEAGSNALTASLGGAAGSAMGGASGVLGHSQADYWNTAMKNVPYQAAQSMAPFLMQQHQTDLMPYQLGAALAPGTYPNQVVNPGEQAQVLGVELEPYLVVRWVAFLVDQRGQWQGQA